mgnify:CR=1 FL=1
MTTDTNAVGIREIDSGALPTRYARGWHCLGVAKDYLDGKPHAVQAFGTKLVVFADSQGEVKVLDAGRIRETLTDEWIRTAVFSADEGVRSAACWLLRRVAAALGACPASIQGLYEAMGRGEVGGFTVPAINIRTLTYDTAQAVFRAAKNLGAGPILFEIARSEIDYTRQRPEEYAAAVLAAAVKVGYEGPVFLQGDHFQVNAKRYAQDPEREVQAVKDLIWEAIEAGF